MKNGLNRQRTRVQQILTALRQPARVIGDRQRPALDGHLPCANPGFSPSRPQRLSADGARLPLSENRTERLKTPCPITRHS